MKHLADAPEYTMLKPVRAFRIGRILAGGYGPILLYPEDTDFCPFKVGNEFAAKHQIKEGDYLILMPDGYQSWCSEENMPLMYAKVEQ